MGHAHAVGLHEQVVDQIDAEIHVLKARERLTAEGRWDECRAEILALTDRHNEARDGRLYVEAEYLVTIGRRND